MLIGFDWKGLQGVRAESCHDMLCEAAAGVFGVRSRVDLGVHGRLSRFLRNSSPLSVPM